jgi:hypothetical protein
VTHAHHDGNCNCSCDDHWRVAVSTSVPASAATVITKNGSYEGGCSGSSCLYKPMKKGAKKGKK